MKVVPGFNGFSDDEQRIMSYEAIVPRRDTRLDPGRYTSRLSFVTKATHYQIRDTDVLDSQLHYCHSFLIISAAISATP